MRDIQRDIIAGGTVHTRHTHGGIYTRRGYTYGGDIYTEGHSRMVGHTHGGDIHMEGTHKHAGDIHMKGHTHAGTDIQTEGRFTRW